VGVFEPRSLRALRLELGAAHVACAMAPKLPPEQQAKIASTAPRDIAAAAIAAAAAGKGEAALSILARRLADPPKACPAGISWEEILQPGFDGLMGGR
jgi:hypothetical protein